jgi:hypothetical protein
VADLKASTSISIEKASVFDECLAIARQVTWPVCIPLIALQPPFSAKKASVAYLKTTAIAACEIRVELP